MFEIEREIAEKELGRLALVILEGLHGTDVLDPIVENKAIVTLQSIREVLDDESRSDFDCVEEIVNILWRAGISTNRHDFG